MKRTLRDNNQPKEISMLVGLAVDVSGSMKQSIRNETGGHLSRIESFNSALNRLAKEAQDTIQENRARNIESSIDLFAYCFGLQNSGICDLLSLMRIAQEVSSTSEYKAFNSLLGVAVKYDLSDWCARANDDGFFSSAIEMAILARQLEADASAGEKLSRLLNGGEPGRIGSFAHFLGAGETYDVGRAYASGDLEEAKEFAKELILRGFNINATDIDEEAESTTLSIEEFTGLVKTYGDTLTNSEALIYGDTPMLKAMTIIAKRFEKELKSRSKETTPVLFVLSDGESTDGDPTPVARDLKSMGVTIISCFITDTDVISPRTLFHKSKHTWNTGAKVMFNLASTISDDSKFHSFLMDKGWAVSPQAKLFAQLNHSKILEEFMCYVLSPLKY